ncbi:alkaline phosphatase family protein [Sphingobium nicotianae]|uniref:Ectonucleotide pyrophosphatase/phosphodiesterase n=1 Tax=Sphingobium nicotianae TaxID=2782607 RepID=A0A9X1DDM8_9SPHN|nr:ectonucleotide pyrophosphatase/phosphodiesterase [Sphingobium nicotianae]MBT2187985.1 ectonucleotide pyrophosphatase/phosphodiesterase [Sphingobium nicotianae]
MGRQSLLAALVLAATPVAASAEPVLMISIDGLRPGDVIEADKRGLKLPNLRRFLTDGAYAQGVNGVLPTLTYPSHTTLLTGVGPAKHGIYSNTTFDPFQANYDGWYWYASDIKVPTLWDAAAKAGLSTGNVHWPVSVGAHARWNLPQIWRAGTADDAKLIGALASTGLVAELEKSLGEPYAAGIDESIDADEKRGRFSIALIKAHKPDFTTVYLTALDHEQHAKGPDTPEAHAVLERIDAIVGKLIDAELAAHPDAAIALVSDHGFEPITSETNFFRAFIDAGLITMDGTKIKDWEAAPWISGGSAAIMLRRPDDAALAARVRAVLEKLKADPATHIAQIIGKDEIATMRGNPEASFYVDLMPGTMTGPFLFAAGPVSGAPHYLGMHGYFPGSANIRSTFMLLGKGIAKGKDLGVIDMRAIAPTVASLLGAELPNAELKALAVR